MDVQEWNKGTKQKGYRVPFEPPYFYFKPGLTQTLLENSAFLVQGMRACMTERHHTENILDR